MNLVFEINDSGIQDAFNRMIQIGEDMGPILRVLGEHEVDRIKNRFQTATAPDGTPWQANAQSTIENYIRMKGGFSDKTGKINQRGTIAAIAKRPLQGETGTLASQIDYAVNSNAVTISENTVYARMQHYGGSKGEFSNLWGDIPARPSMPVMASGDLYPEEERDIIEVVNEELRRVLEG